MEVFVRGLSAREVVLQTCADERIGVLKENLSHILGIPAHIFKITFNARFLCDSNYVKDYSIVSGCTLTGGMAILGGIDFQNRAGSKPGSGGVASEQQANIDRRERLRKLALETVDLSKDPYILKNYLGSFECKLCLTLHNNEGNYLAHTQGKRHQTNLARRAAKEASESSAQTIVPKAVVAPRRTIKIGLPGYKVTKQKDPDTGARMLLFQIDYPEHAEGLQPRHRFMSSYEQKVEVPDKSMQYLLFACEPYETVAFKIPNVELDKSEGKFFSNWDKTGKQFTLQLTFAVDDNKNARPAPPPPRPKLRYH